MSKLDDLRLNIKQSIDQAGQAAAEAKGDPVEFASCFRHLLELTKERYPYYVYARHNIDIREGLTMDDYEAEEISAECEAMLDFCQSERFVGLVRRFDAKLCQGEFPFFTYLNETIKKDGKKIQSEDWMQDKYSGMTGLTEYRNKEREKKIFQHCVRVLDAKGKITPADGRKIAEALGCDLSLVVDVLKREWAVNTGVELDEYLDEEEETRMHDIVADPQTLPPPEEGDPFLVEAYLLLEPVLTAMERDAVRYGLTKALIHDCLLKLTNRLHREDHEINSIPTLFAKEEGYALQQLLVLKAEYEGHPMVEPCLIDLAMNERQSPSFARVAQQLGRSEEAFRKSYNNVRGKLQATLSKIK